MSRNQIFRVLFLGAFAIGGIILIQSYWVVNSWYLVNSEFDEKVSIALRRVAEKMASQSQSELPKEGLIKRLSSNAYAVNYNNFIDPHILEDFLIVEIDALALDVEFEYALYDCYTEELVYGNCCTVDDKDRDSVNKHITELEDLTYYFIVRFPNRQSFLLGQVWIFILLSFLSLLAVFAFLFAIRTIYRQRKLSELHKDFVNNMTHEFKTPLSSIKLSAMVLQGAPEVQGNPRLKNYAGIIYDQSKRLSGQIENVLDIVRSEKKFVLHPETFDLVPFLQQAIEIERVRFEKHSLQIKTNFTIDHWLLEADRYHLSNVISNIVENAVKYHKTDSTKLILEIDLKENGKYMELSFRDNGMGIDENYQKQVFDKFFRIPTGNVHDVKGFGLGLYYVSNICRQHAWEVSVQSEIGKGSCFTISMPMAQIKINPGRSMLND